MSKMALMRLVSICWILVVVVCTWWPLAGKEVD